MEILLVCSLPINILTQIGHNFNVIGIFCSCFLLLLLFLNYDNIVKIVKPFFSSRNTYYLLQ